MSISSLGVGSGLDLEGLVGQLLEAERKPKTDALDSREENVDAEISGIGKLKSKLEDFQETLDNLRSDANLKGREPSINNPSEGVEPFTADASNSALEGNYNIAVTQLASGSRIETADAIDGGFDNSTDTVLSAGTASLTFKIDATSDSFSINLNAGDTLEDLRNAINASNDNFGVTASIIDTGTAVGGAKLVFTSDTPGEGNDLIIVNDNDEPELDRVSTTNFGETINYLVPVNSAQNAKATIDGIDVESKTNKFENVIENVSFEASELSELNADAITFKTSKLSIGFDKESVEETIREFVTNFNALQAEIKLLTNYGESDLEEDGSLAGDSLVRGIQSGINNILFSSVDSSTLGGLFQIGIEYNDNNELEISTSDKIGLGSGDDRLKEALDDNFDQIAALFTDESQGIAVRLYDYVEEYTSSGGLLKSRVDSAKDQREQIFDERLSLELRLAKTEEILRAKYLNLDQTVSRLNSTGSALLATLG
ncbi:flagellar filament capping protein FliD [Paraglaciecola sp. MB-3u-78]|uniref:flagellar filament capping protein FliD n=1 Tax=Paraglaciecola sp. MB-3u-78 TaxID=2058332 RepID=UPI000C34FAD7|nr:flagellar filament capping protein FliD [Paraglaciecola sp. MB-3u-78]PKH00850.1 flagellar hook protein [Paraglaciecola sp. MB-3u-78]